MMKRYLPQAFLLILLLLVSSCTDQKSIVSGIDEREANVILVFLESKGINATKSIATSSGPGGDSGQKKYNIMVEEHQTTLALSILNMNGLPHRQGTNLLELFAKQGLMSTDREENIRYQAGLSSQIANTIMMIDGVIDASVQISFPDSTSTEEGKPEQKITAAIYIKHQGVFDDPNAHLETKIKRLLSGSVTGLSINDVTVIADRSRFTDIKLDPTSEMLSSEPREYVKIWSMVMNKDSAGTFRSIFFSILIIAILFLMVIGWFIWKLYPTLSRKGGFRALLHPEPFDNKSMKASMPKNEPSGEQTEDSE